MGGLFRVFYGLSIALLASIWANGTSSTKEVILCAIAGGVLGDK